jgi:hypothetical protein
LVCGNDGDAAKLRNVLAKQIDEQRGKNLDNDPVVGAKLKGAPSEVKAFLKEVQNSVKVDKHGAIVEVTAGFTLSGLQSFVDALLRVEFEQRADSRDDVKMRPIERPNMKDFGPPRKDFPGFPKDIPNIPKDFPAVPKDFQTRPKDLKFNFPKDFPKIDVPKDGVKIQPPKDSIPTEPPPPRK